MSQRDQVSAAVWQAMQAVDLLPADKRAHVLRVVRVATSEAVGGVAILERLLLPVKQDARYRSYEARVRAAQRVSREP